MEMVRAERVFRANRKQPDIPAKPETPLRGLVEIGLKKGNRMPAGTLKTWNADRGFGFIAVDGGGADLFLHVSDLKAAGIDPESIKVGDRLTFETASTPRPQDKGQQRAKGVTSAARSG
jgi:CspA family cold shock protein